MKLQDRLTDLMQRADQLLSDYNARIQTLPNEEVTHRHLYKDTYKEMTNLRDAIRELGEDAEQAVMNELGMTRAAATFPPFSVTAPSQFSRSIEVDPGETLIICARRERGKSHVLPEILR